MLWQNTALAVQPNPPMDSNIHQADEPAPRGPVRFTHPSGSRPLAGYTIKRGIGRGGFGEVYFAVSDGGKEVAIKLIRHNLDVELRGVTHCLNLKHPNLIALYDVKQDEHENSWVVMEYATGESLEEVIHGHPQGLPVNDAMEWMSGIAAGVGYLHDHGIVHRDLKPGNIFRDDGQIKIGDYGLSKFISCSRRSGQTESIGTVHYMAPEVSNGRYGKEIDIYALGIILYEMLTGHVPFEGESIGEVLMKHLTAEPPVTNVPEPYRQVVARALAKDPTQRFASVAEMMQSLPPLAATMAYTPQLKETRAASDPAPPVQPAYAPPPPQPQAAHAAAAAPLVAAALADEEPIWRAIRDAWQTTRNHWDSFNTPTKVVVAIIGCIALANNASLVVQIGTPLVLLYAIYVIARNVYKNTQSHRQTRTDWSHAATPRGEQRTEYRPRQPEASSRPQKPPEMQATTYYQPSGEAARPGDWRKASQRHWKHRVSKRQWREQAAAALVVKSGRERLADLTGSMLLAATIGAAMSVVVMLLRGESFDKDQYAWLSMVSIGGAWGILIPSKLWEGAKGDPILRRVVMLIVGLVVGAGAWSVANNLLLIEFPDSRNPHALLVKNIGSNFFDAQGRPLLYAYLAYFGALYFIVSWWRQADPLRYARLSIWTTAVCVFWAWVISYLWPFPQPWGLMVAAITSISVQLASPAVPGYQRIARPAGQE
jgi:serine/threonine protein kinase